MVLKKLLLVSIVFGISACVTPPLKRFSEVKVGMYRGEVLDIAGSPQESRFKDDQYVWIYRFLEKDQMISKEVRISKEFVTYVGDPLPPSVEKISKVKIGYGKSEVLDILGFPKRAKATENHDQWFYSTREASEEPTHLITFTDDKVVSIGPAGSEQKSPTPKDEKGFVPVD